MKIWSDYRHTDFTGVGGNITREGHGQEWRSVSGNITIGANATLDGVGLGYPKTVGPGSSSRRSLKKLPARHRYMPAETPAPVQRSGHWRPTDRSN